MTDETPEWMKPSPALKRIADAKEPEILAMTEIEKAAIVRGGAANSAEQERIGGGAGDGLS